MIIGVGTDIVKISRTENLKESFLSRTFTEKELAYCKGNPQSLAGRFAAKEAVSKALGTGIRGFSLRDIEILNNEQGKPYVILHGEAKKYENLKIQISISHEKEYAIAFAVAEEAL